MDANAMDAMDHLCAVVRVVPTWALWTEVAIGLVGLVAAYEQARIRRKPIGLVVLGAGCLAYGMLGLTVRYV